MVFLPTKAVILDDEILTNDWKSYYGMIRDFIAQLVGGDRAEGVVVTDGTITTTKGFVVVDSENELEIDEISQIDITNYVEGNFIALSMANKDHVIVLKHGEDADGGIITYTGADETLKMGDVILLRRDGNLWRQVDLSGYMRANETEMLAMNSEYKVASLAQLSPYLENKALYAIGVLVWAVRNPEGMVPCDNTTEYRLDQFPDVSKMFINGVLPKVTYEEYNLSISSTGVCASFGYDEANGKFYPPFLKPRVIEGTSYYPYISLYNATTAESMLQQQGILDECMVLYANMQAEYENFQAYVDEQLMRVTDAVDDAIATVENTREGVVSQINTATADGVQTINDTTASVVQRVEDAYADFDSLYQEKSQGLITTANNQIVNIDNAAQENIAKSRTWATGEQAEVEILETGKLSSRGYADIAMAIANEEEDVPVDTSKLIALDSIRGPRGYNGRDGEGVPTGGNTGQVLIKKSGTDYDTQWGTLDALPSQTGNDGKFLTTDGTEASWADVGGGLEIGDIGFAPLGIDEAQNKRRYLNGQVISQAQFVSFTNKVKAAVQLNPSLATSEVNWQAEVTNSKLGQCGKFVIDDTLGTIRLPKVVNINGLQDLALMGSIKDESLPNITGEIQIRSVTNASTVTGSGVFTLDKHSGTSTNSLATTSNVNNDVLTFNASNGSSAYQDNAPVQQEAVQYPYFIQVATGTEESVDVTREIELNNPFSLLDYKWSEYELNNASWLLSNGQFNSGATYISVYNLLLEIYNGTETKDGVSVKMSTEAYTDTDFVLNTADTTFRLPIKVKLASGASIVGNGMTLGLTNGTTNYGLNTYNPQYGDALTGRTVSYGTNVGDTNNTGSVTTAHKSLGVTTDPAKSGIETSLSGLKLYFYVGETIQDANVIAASNVLTTIANADYVIESYNDGTNWYRVYKSGWCEQGGRVISTAYDNINTTVTYLKPFANVDYSISAISISQTRSYPTVDVRSYNTTGCVINRNNSYGISWEAKGYIA